MARGTALGCVPTWLPSDFHLPQAPWMCVDHQQAGDQASVRGPRADPILAARLLCALGVPRPDAGPMCSSEGLQPIPSQAPPSRPPRRPAGASGSSDRAPHSAVAAGDMEIPWRNAQAYF